ncbi:uncharacterized protein EDB93DRAFT_1108122 [Suillus bovinus]|uniref:uncharacterized protein n=1 Tax=Suillus bovinus TaxID=48563 RepID=UPI001B868B09|nr:uncharacterized protein EDB93DRAFT_1109238 [Suillus bovinus]XP_041301072.1 uncharacterized protein EDB93DRAFT_1109243 [Suillus bovinus]XP_041302486.1 uncharacterized protein EDB93DRAFT_1108122 [Suillus bovinus]KAG2127580.1 hypothetical protein EDB93DRAFT_1109238 [Suillus bovinus]KAG2127585.1 hypothetical protein EDB93DRAFT_1109243 [Suillus bovinus]KAG2131429.1 hypothetical protein EDB93DRAFT_1108122 [Suillus bovinus]
MAHPESHKPRHEHSPIIWLAICGHYNLKFAKMRNDFQNVAQIMLEQNYSSAGSILATSLAIISQGFGDFAVLRGHQFFERAKVHLQLVDNPSFEPAFFRAINNPSLGIGDELTKENSGHLRRLYTERQIHPEMLSIVGTEQVVALYDICVFVERYEYDKTWLLLGMAISVYSVTSVIQDGDRPDPASEDIDDQAR